MLFVDAHVHLYDFDIDEVFFAARRNFRAAAATLNMPAETVGCLFLTESSSEASFEGLRSRLGHRRGGWTIEATDEDCTLSARADGGPPLLIVAGCQIATAEGLEVLGAGTCMRVQDGTPVEVALRQLREAGALEILPWGFGKWWMGRGRTLRDLILRASPGELCLGDNGGRPTLPSSPSAFCLARNRNIPILPGSDPLPLAWQACRVGSYGFTLPIDPLGDGVAARIISATRALKGSPRPFGRRIALTGFLRAQIALRCRSA